MNNKYIKSTSMLVVILFLQGVLLLSTGCFSSKGTTGNTQNSNIESVLASPQQDAVAPVLFAGFDDESGSIKSARITRLQERDLVTLIDILRLTGGELAFGLIGDATDRPLLRLRIPVPPIRPAKTEIQNAFERAEQDAQFQGLVEKYEADVRHWKEDVDLRVNAFLDAVRPRLQGKAMARRSPIYTALTRSELFLNEPGNAWPMTPHRYIILNSDAIDTTKSTPVTIKSGATLILINGSGSVGVLESLHPLRFESIQAALEYITATEIRRNK
jgi:hypothetical protein